MKPRDDATPRRIMTAPELAEFFNVDRTTIYKWARKGKIAAFKIGDDWRFDRDEIDNWTTDRTSEVLKKSGAAVARCAKENRDGVCAHPGQPCPSNLS